MPGGTDGGDERTGAADPNVVLSLPDELRGAFKDPLGPVYQDVDRLLADAGRPVVAVGDVVTYHLETAGSPPDVAVLDGYTERERIGDELREALGDLVPDVANPPATISAELLSALREAVATPERTRIVVDGEEDLATLPAVLAAPRGASVVYGQPGEGMVLVSVDEESQRHCRDLVGRMDGDHRRFDALLGLDDPD